MVLMTMFSIMLYRVAVIVSMYESTKGTVFSPYAGWTSMFTNKKVYIFEWLTSKLIFNIKSILKSLKYAVSLKKFWDEVLGNM